MQYAKKGSEEVAVPLRWPPTLPHQAFNDVLLRLVGSKHTHPGNPILTAYKG